MPGAAAKASHPARAFLLRFLLYWGALLAANALIPAIMSAAVAGTVASVLATLALFGVRAISSEETIIVGSAAVRIVSECTPVFAFLTLSASLLAFPGSWRARLIGMAIALPALWLYNIVRVLVTLWVLSIAPQHFELVHGYLWQAATILVVIGMFLLWTQALERRTA
jgi:exosortase/archaeosortase family protein